MGVRNYYSIGGKKPQRAMETGLGRTTQALIGEGQVEMAKLCCYT